jgi:hypothetical protein
MINPIKIWWEQWGWQLKAISIAVLLGIVLLSVVFYKACNRPPKLNQVEIQKAQKAIAEQDRKEMIQVLAESEAREQVADEAREQVADETAVNANAEKLNAIHESKEKWATASTDDMAAELERRARESQ